MRVRWMVAAGVIAACAGAGLLVHEHGHRREGEGTLLHVRNQFVFVMEAPMETAFPLFGAKREREWDSSWEPEFVHPSPAEDVAGAVFRVKHGHYEATWINTAFDEAHGHVQYVYLLPDVMVTLIDIQLTPVGADRTQAQVVYERTALSAGGNPVVAHRGEVDGKMGPQWAELINGYLQKTKP